MVRARTLGVLSLLTFRLLLGGRDGLLQGCLYVCLDSIFCWSDLSFFGLLLGFTIGLMLRLTFRLLRRLNLGHLGFFQLLWLLWLLGLLCRLYFSFF